MASGIFCLREVEFTYPSSPNRIFNDLSITLAGGFTGVIGPNGSGKTTLLKLATGLLTADDGAVSTLPGSVYCAQRADYPPQEFLAFLEDYGSRVYMLRNRLGIEQDWLTRWQQLSHGERKRAQIGVALWLEPTVLAIDEPTNHLDENARSRLVEELSAYTGTGLLVSHDRELLDRLCCQCIWLGGESPTLYSGGYTAASETREAERNTAVKSREKAKNQYSALQRERSSRLQQDIKAQRRRSKRAIAPKDHSAKAAINLAKNTDSSDGQRLRQLDGRLAQAKHTLANAKINKQYTVNFEMPGTPCARKLLLHSASQEVTIGESLRLSVPALELRSSDHVALVGPNGLGKSRLLAQLIPQLKLEQSRVLYMPQEITSEQSASILQEVKRLPRDELGHAMNVVNSLGSNPAALLDSVVPSPGEMRKLLLALGMTRRPQLLVLDEPTNHLDLPAIEALERALTACECAVLLVSHDASFAASVCNTQWQIKKEPTGARLELERHKPSTPSLWIRSH